MPLGNRLQAVELNSLLQRLQQALYRVTQNTVVRLKLSIVRFCRMKDASFLVKRAKTIGCRPGKTSLAMRLISFQSKLTITIRLHPCEL